MAIQNLTDSDFDDLVNACMARVNLKKVDWSIDQADIDEVTPLLTIWNTKYAVVKNKNMANSADREAKTLAREELEPVFSNFIEVNIYRNANMNASDISSCDLEPRKTTRTPSGKPQTIPQMEYRASQSHTIKAFYRQSPGTDGVSKRGKPKGVGRIEIAYLIIDQAPEPPAPNPNPNPNAPAAASDNPANLNPDDFPKRISGTRTPVIISFLPIDAGKFALFFSRWVSTGNSPGDWGQLEFMMVP